MMYRTVAAIAVVALTAVACSDDDEAAPETTVAATTQAPVPTTVPDTTAVASTTSSAPTTTAAPTSTSNNAGSEQAVRQQIRADLEAIKEMQREMAQEFPPLDQIDARAARLAIEGSPEFDAIVEAERNAVNDRIRSVPGDPPINRTMVDSIDMVGSGPRYEQASVRYCTVTNAFGVRETTTASTELITSREIVASRYEAELRITEDGWKLYDDKFIDSWEGFEECVV